jgi:2-polyprenyl-3-methyl-5-hydroxy-6-metoxy-1,4-benzoquinol methylase
MSYEQYIKYYNKIGGGVYLDNNGDTVHLLDDNLGEYSRINLESKKAKHWYARQICNTISKYIEVNNLFETKIDILVMGVALGSIIIELLNDYPNVFITGIDISNEYFEFVKSNSDIRRLKLIKQDAMMYINYSNEIYDIVVCDIFNGINLPNFILNSKFLYQINKILKSNGLFIMNTINVTKDRLHNKLSESFGSNIIIKSNNEFSLRSNTISIVNKN